MSFFFSLRFLAGLLVGGLIIWYFKESVHRALLALRAWLAQKLGRGPPHA